MTFITLNIGDLLEAAKDMYAEIETLATENQIKYGLEAEGDDWKNDLDKWLSIIRKYDPMYLVPQDECIPTEDK